MDKGNESASLALGIDIGGSHITTGMVDLVHKKVIEGSVIRKLVNRHAPADEILGIWAAAVNSQLLNFQQPIARVGFAMPGPFDYTNGICRIKGFDKYEALFGMNIRQELAARTGVPAAQIVFRNDAEAFLDGEMADGAGRGFARALGLTLGTGLGSCLYVEGEITNAGLNVLPFKHGIAEEYLSTRWFIKAYQQHTGKQVSGVKDLADRYNEDELTRLIFEEFSVNLGELLLHCLRTCNVQAIIVGGNISNAFSLFIDQVMKQLPADAVIKKAKLGEQAAIIGATLQHKHHMISAYWDAVTF